MRIEIFFGCGRARAGFGFGPDGVRVGPAAGGYYCPFCRPVTAGGGYVCWQLGIGRGIHGAASLSGTGEVRASMHIMPQDQ